MKVRLDKLLVQRGLFDSRARAQAAIEAGGVKVDGAPARSAHQAVAEDAVIEARAAHEWVGRGALKLVAALDLWPVAVEGRTVLDLGASTGGFTEVCLARGAARVFAVDVGRGQLHPKMAGDRRVTVLEGTDVRALTVETISPAPELVVCDLSFISLTKALKVPLSLAVAGAELVALVKPQFEQASRAEVGKGGVVSDPEARAAALARVTAWLEARGWTVRATVESPVPGGDGNREWLLWASGPSEATASEDQGPDDAGAEQGPLQP